MEFHDRFNIENFIAKAKNKYFLDYCKQEIDRVNNINFTKNKEIEYHASKYRAFIHAFYFLLMNGLRPLSYTDEDFLKTRPIIEALIVKGNLTKKILNIYEK